MGYSRFIEENLSIVDKENNQIPFTLNSIQKRYMEHDVSNRDIILKARQQGFSSLILARFTADFLLKPNSQSVIVADSDDNAEILLSRVKLYLQSWEDKNKQKVPLKYNSKNSLHNEVMNSTYTIGTARNQEFGRSRTITNLHLSEAAFYPNLEKILAGAGNAVTPSGYIVLETTANGFNEFKELWDKSRLGGTEFKASFYKASDFYSKEFLDAKRLSNPRLFKQEFPENDIEAFLTSGNLYFDSESIQRYLTLAQEPMKIGTIYG